MRPNSLWNEERIQTKKVIDGKRRKWCNVICSLPITFSQIGIMLGPTKNSGIWCQNKLRFRNYHQSYAYVHLRPIADP